MQIKKTFQATRSNNKECDITVTYTYDPDGNAQTSERLRMQSGEVEFTMNFAKLREFMNEIEHYPGGEGGCNDN